MIDPLRSTRRNLLSRAAVLPLGLAFGSVRVEPTDDELRALWSGLSPEDRAEIAEWFSAECGRLETFQVQLARYVLHGLDVSKYDWPLAPANAPLYDPNVHCPEDPIRRSYISPDSQLARRWLDRLPRRRVSPAWRYDYGQRTVQKLGDPRDPDRLFNNALAGYLPDQDLLEALLERALDDGSQQNILAAFAHGYADRTGRAVPGVTLYDAWGTGERLEMPDVECLGIVHDVLDDWKTWVAPVPERKHEALYDAIGKLYTRARRHRGLREALARTYLASEPDLAGGYDGAIGTLHSVWESRSSEPEKVAEALPDTGAWQSWLEKEGRRPARDAELGARAAARRKTLQADGSKVRGVLVWVLREYGALKR